MNVPRMIVVPTIDVEGVHGRDPFAQMILGEVEGGNHGVFEIADILADKGAEGSFFVDVYESSLWGEEPFARLCRQLHDQGQDVELHTHPGWRDDSCDFPWLRQLKRERSYVSGIKDMMAKLSADEQFKLLEEGAAMIDNWTGTRPRVHRSGGYSINEDTFDALERSGFLMDSSIHYSHSNTKFYPTKGRAVMVGNLFELPVSLMRYRTSLQGRSDWSKLLKTDVDTSWIEELIHYVEQGLSANVRFMNLFMHSYSLISFDPIYRKYRYAPEKARTLAEFLSYCRKHPQVEVMSCRQLLADDVAKDYLLGGSDQFPEICANRHIAALGFKMLKNRVYELGLGERLLRGESVQA